MKCIPGLDILKFLLAFCIVGIHSNMSVSFGLLQGYVDSLLALAVPTFFVISSYLFFGKQKHRSSNEQTKNLIHYSKRLLMLYAFWSLIELPFVLPYHCYIQTEKILYILGKFGIDFFLNYTYPSSWFFPALLVGIIIMHYANKFSRHIAFILSSLIYIYIYSSGNVFGADHRGLFDWYESKIAAPSCSVAGGLFWIEIGYMLQGLETWNKYRYSSYVLNFTFVMGIGLCLISPIMRPLSVICLFIFFKNIHLNYNTVRLRKYSTMVYCFHYALIFVLWRIPFFPNTGISLTIIAFTIAVAIASQIHFISTKDNFHFLKYLM